MSSSGAGVLQLRAVEYARNHGVRIHCRSSFDDGPGTLVVAEDETLEQPMVTAVTHAYEARVTLTGLSDEPGVAGRVFSALADANVNVDMIIQNEPVSADQKADLSFTVANDDLQPATDVLEPLEVGDGVETDADVGKVSIVGAGMRSHPGVAAKVFETLGDNEINIEMISTSPIKISCVIAADRCPTRCRRSTRRSTSATTRSARRTRRASTARGCASLAMRREPPIGSASSAPPAPSARRSSQVLAERDFPASEVVPFASERSAGTRLAFGDGEIECRPLSDGVDRGLDLVLSSAGGAISSEWAPRFVEAGAVVVDNTSFWRMHDDVPLVVPEVNPEAAERATTA